MTGYQRARGVVPAAPYRVAVVRWLDTTSPLGWQSPDDLDGDPCTPRRTSRSGGSTLISLIYSMGPIIRSEWVAQVDPGESVGDAIQRVARYVGQQFGLAASDANKLGATQSSS